MLYWFHVAGTFLMRFIPVDIAYRLVGGATPLVLQVFARGHLRRATDNMRQVLGPQADPREADGVAVTFFGRTTRVPGGAATLALRTGSPVVPAALVRDPRGRGYLAHIGPPIVGSKGDDASVVMQGIMSWLEGIIRRYPDQWFMFRRMWPVSGEPLL